MLPQDRLGKRFLIPVNGTNTRPTAQERIYPQGPHQIRQSILFGFILKLHPMSQITFCSYHHLAWNTNSLQKGLAVLPCWSESPHWCQWSFTSRNHMSLLYSSVILPQLLTKSKLNAKLNIPQTLTAQPTTLTSWIATLPFTWTALAWEFLFLFFGHASVLRRTELSSQIVVTAQTSFPLRGNISFSILYFLFLRDNKLYCYCLSVFKH